MENPFLDLRVREALSLAINREAIVERIQFGSGAPAGQFAPEGIFGHNPDIEAPPTTSTARASCWRRRASATASG
jgi:peptide/nickel transport system substrate-binding protein